MRALDLQGHRDTWIILIFLFYFKSNPNANHVLMLACVSKDVDHSDLTLKTAPMLSSLLTLACDMCYVYTEDVELSLVLASLCGRPWLISLVQRPLASCLWEEWPWRNLSGWCSHSPKQRKEREDVYVGGKSLETFHGPQIRKLALHCSINSKIKNTYLFFESFIHGMALFQSVEQIIYYYWRGREEEWTNMHGVILPIDLWLWEGNQLCNSTLATVSS